MAYNLKDFTIEQKIKLLAGQDAWHTEDFGGKIYKVKVSDGPVGLRMPTKDPDSGNWYDKPAVAYPASHVLSQTWDTELAYKMGECMANDCIEENVDVLLGPGVNIKRNPLCGRNFEYYSEDPYVAGVFGREVIKGLQDNHVGATLKHYCANNQELCRFWTSSEIDERTLREIYLKAFQIAEEGKPWAVMCAYNLVNGLKMSEHSKLFKVLREEFGHDDRLIMSDWSAVFDHVAAVKASLDLEMPYSDKGYNRLLEGYKNGEITEEEIDLCVQRVLDFIEKAEKASKVRKVTKTVEERLAMSRKIASEGITLLKNDGALPISASAKIAITGRGSDEYVAGGGSARVQPITKTPITLVQALKEQMGENNVCHHNERGAYEQTYVAVNNAYGKDLSIVCVSHVQGEGRDRENMKLEKKQEMLIKECAKQNKNTLVVVYSGAPIDMSEWIDDVSAVIWAGYPGEMGALALADIILGNVNPSGKLTESFPLTTSDAISEYNHSDFSRVDYSEGLFVGYRYYDGANEEGLQTLFPFGFGLSYSEFEYSNLNLTKENGGVRVAFDIKNISNVDGAEVAQIYVREPHSKVVRPYKELKEFVKVYLKAGETKRVEVMLPESAFEFYSVARDKWHKEGGIYEIIIGASSQDIRLRDCIEN